MSERFVGKDGPKDGQPTLSPSVLPERQSIIHQQQQHHTSIPKLDQGTLGHVNAISTVHGDAYRDTPDEPLGSNKRRRLNDSSPSSPSPTPHTSGRYLEHSKHFGSDTGANLDKMRADSSTPSKPSRSVIPDRPSTQPTNAPHVSSATPTFTTPSGAVLTLQNAGFILSAYLQSYGLDPSHFKATSTFTLVPPTTLSKRSWKPGQPHQPPPDSLFHCTITLPKPCPISTLTSPGLGYRSKDLAKKHVTMEIIKLLLEAGEITPDLAPRPRDKTTKRERKIADSAQQAIAGPSTRTDPVESQQKADDSKKGVSNRPGQPIPGIKGIAEYPHIPHAGFWSSCPMFTPGEIYPTIIELLLEGTYRDKTDECRKLCLITSRPLPIFGGDEEYVIDLTNQSVGTKQEKVEAKVKLTRGRRMKTWEDDRLDQAMKYTQRLVRAQINKPAEGSLETSRWLIVPIVPDFQVGVKIRRRDIAWEEVEKALGPLCTPFSFDDTAKLREEFTDAISTPNAEFSRRMYVKSLRSDLTPNSTDPCDLKGEKTILGNFPTPVELTKLDQPIFQTDVVNTFRHGGFIAGLSNPKLHDKYMVPELTYRHSISASVFKTATILPTVLAAVDDLLVAKNLSDHVFGGKLDIPTTLIAITCPTVHGQNHTKSYQRLEMLGDTLLKLLIAVYLLYRLDDGPVDWDGLNQDRQVMVSNRTLQSRAIEAGVVPYIRGASGKTKEWLPMGWDAKDHDPNEDKSKVKSEAVSGPSDPTNPPEKEAITDEVEGVKDGLSRGSVQGGGDQDIPIIKDRSGDSKEPKERPSVTKPNESHAVASSAPMETSKTDLPVSDHTPRPASPTRGNHPDKLQTVAWSLKRHRPDDPVFLRQSLGDKTVADIAESLVAASYLSSKSDINGAITAMHTLKMPLENFGSWQEVVSHSKGRNDLLKKGMVKGGEHGTPLTILGYEFNVPRHGRDALALSHEPERKNRFLQYKILGDAVLDYFMVEGLFLTYPSEGPGSLTVMRHSRHGDTALAAYSVISGLVDLITDVNIDASNNILRYKKAVLTAKKAADEAKEDAERIEFWAEIASPNPMAEMVNAIFGCMLVDSNYDLEKVRTVYTQTLLPFIDRYCVGPGERSPHPRTVWTEMISKRGCAKWEVRKDDGITKSGLQVSSVWLHDQLIGKGLAESQTLSLRKACEEAVKTAKSKNALENICNCPKKRKHKGT